MLSRVANYLYWLSRYVERAEHTARLLDVNLAQMLEDSPEATGRRWERLQTTLGQSVEGTTEPMRIAKALTFNADYASSIVSSIATARENARQVREQISTEMWFQINRLYHQVAQSNMDEQWKAEPHHFYHRMVIDGLHLFNGITEATFSRGEGWHFMQAGRFIERAISTSLLLNTHFEGVDLATGYPNLSPFECANLLRSCTSLEAYNKVYTAHVQPKWVVEFLLLNPQSPRSVRFAAGRIQESIQAIKKATSHSRGAEAERLAGRLKAGLDYAQVDEMMAEGLAHYCTNIKRQSEKIHNAIYQGFINSHQTLVLP